MNQRWQQISEAFKSLMDLPEVERQAELEKLAARDSELASYVAILLEQDAAGGFIPPPDPIPPCDSLGKLTPGTRIGNYEIRQVLGEGSAGTVYLASRVKDYDKFVAIKVLHSHLSGNSFVRFELEMQSLALLEHPNIVRLHDGGTTESGLPYFVTEYLDGEKLTTYCDTRNLPIAERVRLVVSAAKAIGNAHENDVLHRDICPSNVMVTRDGTVKVIDFGLVHFLKPISKTIHTSQGITIGTVGYIAPEQILGLGSRNGFAVDCYGMGATLYRLISGQIPFTGNSPYEICNAATTKEPTSPRKINPEIPKDLETIVLKALAKEPGERFTTMDALAEQLELFLAGKPLTIQPPGIRKKLEKWANRHRKAVAAWAAILTSLLFLLLGVLLSANYRVNRALQEARLDRQNVERTSTLMKATLRDLTLASVSMTESLPLGSSRTHEYLQRIFDITERAIIQIPMNREDPEILYRTGIAHHHLARSFDSRNSATNRPMTLHHYGRAIESFGTAARLRPDKEWYRYNLARSLAFRAYVHFANSDPDKAEADAREALKTAEALNKDFPGNPDWIDALAFHHNTLAGFLYGRSKTGESRHEAEEGLRIARELISRFPDKPVFLANEYRALTMLADVANKEDRLQDAATLTSEAMKVNEVQKRKTPEDEHYHEAANISLLSKQAEISRRMGDIKSAEDHFQAAIARADRISSRHPQFDLYVFLPHQLRIAKGKLHFETGDEKRAEALFREVIDAIEKLNKERPELIEARTMLADLYETCPVSTLQNPERARMLKPQ